MIAHKNSLKAINASMIKHRNYKITKQINENDNITHSQATLQLN